MTSKSEHLETGVDMGKVREIPAFFDDTMLSRLKQNYEIEVGLANRLKNSRRDERIGGGLYTSVYNELFATVTDHPQIEKAKQVDRLHVQEQVSIIKKFLPADKRFLEVGAGDAHVSIALLDYCQDVYSLDITEEVMGGHPDDEKFHFVLSDGVSVPVESASIDFAYSNQLLEHLHPDDALEQTTNIRTALAPGGAYYCVTPSRHSGPHDVSRHFDDTATGLHLKEYDYAAITSLFKAAGFKKLTFVVAGGDRVYFTIPLSLSGVVEKSAVIADRMLGRALRDKKLFRGLTGVRLLAQV